MAVLTRQQVERLAEIIRQHVSWFTWRAYGKDRISEADLNELKRLNILPMDVSVPSIQYSYVLGRLESLLKRGEWRELSWEQLQREAEGRYTPLDKLQIAAADLSAEAKLRGLRSQIENKVYDTLAQETNRTISEAQVKGRVRDAVQMGVEVGRSYAEVAKKLVDTLREPTRDWTRVASTEMHTARQMGTANAILQKQDVYEDAEGEDSNVIVVPDPDACSDCLEMYTEGGKPKVFKLSYLMANAGTNYIKPWRRNAKPVVPPLHPNCYCRLQYVPPGWDVGDDGEVALVNPEKAYGRKAK